MKQQGFTTIPNVLHSYGLSDAEFRIWCLLASHRNNKTGLIFPSVTRITTLSGKKERAVRNILKKLSEKGLIEITRCEGTSNRYELPDLERLARESSNAAEYEGTLYTKYHSGNDPRSHKDVEFLH